MGALAEPADVRQPPAEFLSRVCSLAVKLLKSLGLAPGLHRVSPDGLPNHKRRRRSDTELACLYRLGQPPRRIVAPGRGPVNRAYSLMIRPDVPLCDIPPRSTPAKAGAQPPLAP